MTFKSRHISIAIDRSFEDVYTFASNPENLPQWASGLSKSKISKVNGEWVTDSPMGQVKVKFAEKNEFGVLDHDVTLPSAVVVHNPMRVLRNNKGSEIVFTLYQQPDMSADAFEKDAAHVEVDLKKIKSILEK